MQNTTATFTEVQTPAAGRQWVYVPSAPPALTRYRVRRVLSGNVRRVLPEVWAHSREHAEVRARMAYGLLGIYRVYPVGL